MNPLINALAAIFNRSQQQQPQVGAPAMQPQANQFVSQMPQQIQQQPQQGNNLAQRLVGILDAGLSAQPQYQKSAMGSAQLQAAREQNRNAPIVNNLNNQLLQQKLAQLGITNQMLPQTLQSKIMSNAANANLHNMQSQFMPTKYQIMQDRMEIDKRRYSPEQLATLQKLRQTQIDTAPQRALSADGKHVVERANLDSGYAPAGNDWQQQLGNLSKQQPLPLSEQQVNKLQSIFPQQGQPNQNPLQQAMGSVIPGQPQQNNQPMIPGQMAPQNQQQLTAPVKTDAGDFIAPQYTKNPNLLQYDMLANKKATTDQTRKQFEAARQLEGFVNKPETRKSLIAYTKYAGLLGQGDKFLDSLKTTKPELYKKAMEAEKVTISNFANLQRRLENLGVQESQREEIRNNFDGAVKAMRSDPDLSLSLMNAALRQMNEVTGQIYATAQPIRKVFTQHEFKPLSVGELGSSKATSQYSQEDIEHTAKTHGMTVEQVKQRLGVN